MKDGQKVDKNSVALLVKAGKAGDRTAFDKLVRLYQRRAMLVAVRVLGDANDAAEAVQVGFLKAYLSINKLKEPKRFDFWLLRIVTNTAISQRRTAKRRSKLIRDVDCSGKESKFLSPVDKRIAEELKVAVQRAMLKLSKKESEAIALFGLEDLSQRQVAQIMGCSVEAVRWHVYSARQKLKVLLKEYL